MKSGACVLGPSLDGGSGSVRPVSVATNGGAWEPVPRPCGSCSQPYGVFELKRLHRPVRDREPPPAAAGVVLGDHAHLAGPARVDADPADDADEADAVRVVERDHVAGLRQRAVGAVGDELQPAAGAARVVADDVLGGRRVGAHAVDLRHEAEGVLRASPTPTRPGRRGSRRRTARRRRRAADRTPECRGTPPRDDGRLPLPSRAARPSGSTSWRRSRRSTSSELRRRRGPQRRCRSADWGPSPSAFTALIE